MKYSEMNQRQKKAFRNVKYAAYVLIGGLESCKLDSLKDSRERKDYEAALKNHNWLVNEIYHMATTGVYSPGFCGFTKADKLYVRDINFCGKDFILGLCEEQVKEAGY